MKKEKPTGFVAICRCGENVGVIDDTRTDRKVAGKMLSNWLADGCTIKPRFGDKWIETITTCKCSN